MIAISLIILVLYISTYLLLILHELGHLICALIVKQKVYQFVIGFGKSIFYEKIFGIEIQLNKLSSENKKVGGYVNMGESISGHRISLFLIAFGGVAMNILVMVVTSISLFLGTNTELLTDPLIVMMIINCVFVAMFAKIKIGKYTFDFNYIIICIIPIALLLKNYSQYDVFIATTMLLYTAKSALMTLSAIFGGKYSDGYFLMLILKSKEPYMTLKSPS